MTVNVSHCHHHNNHNLEKSGFTDHPVNLTGVYKETVYLTGKWIKIKVNKNESDGYDSRIWTQQYIEGYKTVKQ